uniref:Uncharacterized protein n=1 Tax=Arundo donax TaxID=35708 RepID=A0A0A9GBS0_ARUDO
MGRPLQLLTQLLAAKIMKAAHLYRSVCTVELSI